MGKKSRKSASVPPKRSAPLVPPSPGALDAIAEEASRPPSRTPSTSGPGLLDALDRKMEQDVEAALLTAASESLSRIDAALDFSEDEEEAPASPGASPGGCPSSAAIVAPARDSTVPSPQAMAALEEVARLRAALSEKDAELAAGRAAREAEAAGIRAAIASKLAARSRSWRG